MLEEEHKGQLSSSISVVGLEKTAIDPLKASLRGELLQPDDKGYDHARRVWNGMINRKPALIVRCDGVADVITAVNFARTHHLLVAVRGGGHNVTGNAVCEGGLVIDLSRMKGIRVDPVTRTAWAQAGLTLGEFVRETPGVWARDHGRCRLHDRSVRPHPRWRPGLVDGQIWSGS